MQKDCNRSEGTPGQKERAIFGQFHQKSCPVDKLYAAFLGQHLGLCTFCLCACQRACLRFRSPGVKALGIKRLCKCMRWPGRASDSEQ